MPRACADENATGCRQNSLIETPYRFAGELTRTCGEKAMGANDTSEFASLLDELIARGPDPQQATDAAAVDFLSLLDELDAARVAITDDGVVAQYFEAAANVRFVAD